MTATLLEQAAQAESATAPDRVMFTNAAKVIWGPADLPSFDVWLKEKPVRRARQWVKFTGMLAADAWTSAAQ